MTAREVAINTYGYIWSTPAEACVRRLAALGYRHFELVIHPPHLPLDGFAPPARRALKAALDDVGASVSALNLPSLDHNLASAHPRVRAASVQMFDDAIDLAADLGAPWLVTVPGRMSPLFPPPATDRSRWLTESFSQLLPRAEARGVGLAVENVPFAAFPDALSLGAFVRGFNSPRIGVCYDAANAHFVGESPAEGLKQLADLVRVVHLSDTTPSAWRHDRIGLGTVPVAEVAQALDEIGFAGPCTLEIIDSEPEQAILRSHRALVPLGFSPCIAEDAA
jgi:sugar phosphate isomerase/epimerase